MSAGLRTRLDVEQEERERLAPWADVVREFREEGFYERFAAKGEVERVARVQKELARAAGIEIGQRLVEQPERARIARGRRIATAAER